MQSSVAEFVSFNLTGKHTFGRYDEQKLSIVVQQYEMIHMDSARKTLSLMAAPDFVDLREDLWLPGQYGPLADVQRDLMTLSKEQHKGNSVEPAVEGEESEAKSEDQPQEPKRLMVAVLYVEAALQTRRCWGPGPGMGREKPGPQSELKKEIIIAAWEA